mgnify:CR=1 FL=1
MKNQIRMLFAAVLMTSLCAGPAYAESTAYALMQQNSHAVKGVVKDAVGPMAGVNVLIKGTTTGMMTNQDGSFNLPDVPVGATLEFSFMGYQTVEVKVGSSETVNVTLKEDQNLLEELVVIGYGTVKKSDVTGSVASVGGEAIEKLSSGDAIEALQGRAAGVQIVTAGGSPDAVAEIKIRGTGSPNGSDPLFVVDGFPMTDINYLSPNDIASIEILKDASACAIYGSRGANGVVMVTTKQAEKGATKTDIKIEYGIQMTPRKPEMLSGPQYAEMTNKALANTGRDPKYTNPGATQTTDWFNETMRTGKYQNYSIRLSAGTEKTKTMFSAGYFSRQGTVKSTNFDRFTLSSNSEYKPLDFLTFRASLNGTFSKANPLGADGTNNNSIFLFSLIAPPDVPVWDDVTNYYSGITAMRMANPAGAISRNYAVNKRNFLVGNFSADVKFLKDFVFTSRFGYKYNIDLNSNFTPIYFETSNIASGNTATSRTTSFSTDWTWENMLTYSKKVGVHDISVMAAMSARDYYYEWYSGNKKNLPSEAEQFRYFDAASDTSPYLGGSASALGMLSYLGRINYNLLDRYLFTASFRADGSSRFVDSKKWGYFPSGAFAWKVSEEPLFKEHAPEWFNSAKLRLGWGQIGNERIGSSYPYQTNIVQERYYNLGDDKHRVNGSTPSGLGNRDLQWETSEQSNIGIDFAFINSKLTASVDAYIRTTDNILLYETVPRTSGTGSFVRNVGGIENKGIEIVLGWKDDLGDFSYSIDANASFVRNNVKDLGSSGVLQSGFAYDNALMDFSSQFSNIIRSYVGLPYGQFYGYEFLGIFQNQEQINNYKNSEGKMIMPDAKPGDSIFRDINGDGAIDKSDYVRIGDPNPAATFGISFNASWKNFDLSMLFQGTVGNDIFNASKFYFNKFDGRQNVLAKTYMTAWDGEGTSDTTPIMLADAGGGTARNNRNWSPSTMYIEDGSYFRLKTLQIGYNFDFGKKFPGMRLYVSADNLLTLTKYSGVDPELPSIGVDRGQYPQPRTFVIGLNVKL